MKIRVGARSASTDDRWHSFDKLIKGPNLKKNPIIGGLASSKLLSRWFPMCVWRQELKGNLRGSDLLEVYQLKRTSPSKYRS
jgi:hypothetical protein